MPRTPMRSRRSRVSGASRPTGAKMKTTGCSASGGVIAQQRIASAEVRGYAGQDALEIGERQTDAQPVVFDAEFPYGGLVAAGALLHHGQRLAHRALRLEKTQNDHAV